MLYYFNDIKIPTIYIFWGKHMFYTHNHKQPFTRLSTLINRTSNVLDVELPQPHPLVLHLDHLVHGCFAAARSAELSGEYVQWTAVVDVGIRVAAVLVVRPGVHGELEQNTNDDHMTRQQIKRCDENDKQQVTGLVVAANDFLQINNSIFSLSKSYIVIYSLKVC